MAGLVMRGAVGKQVHAAHSFDLWLWADLRHATSPEQAETLLSCPGVMALGTSAIGAGDSGHWIRGLSPMYQGTHARNYQCHK